MEKTVYDIIKEIDDYLSSLTPEQLQQVEQYLKNRKKERLKACN